MLSKRFEIIYTKIKISLIYRVCLKDLYKVLLYISYAKIRVSIPIYRNAKDDGFRNIRCKIYYF